MISFQKYFAAFMCLVYMLIGAGLAWGKGPLGLNSPLALPVGLTFILYGAFRAYRVYQKYFAS